MDLTGGYAVWPALDGALDSYAPLDTSLTCDVLVLGGGITGATLAHALVREGFDTVVLDRRNFGWGSTSGSTALLLYEIDTHLTDLIRSYGYEAALVAYRAGVAAIAQTRDLCAEVGGRFADRSSVYFASSDEDVVRLAEEYETRRSAGLRVEWVSREAFAREFDFASGGAIRSLDAAEIDPFHLAHALLRAAAAGGARLYARTEATECFDTGDGVVIVRTNRGPEIRCRWVVVACGFESLKYLKASVPVSLHSSYAFVTEPIRDFPGWPERSLLWETARPYIYARTTSEGRALFGGEDVPFQHELTRDALLPRQTKRLADRWTKLFPRIPLEIAFCWSGTFAETRDGLPYIGFTPEQPRAFFALCYGGNGITYSVLASELLIAALRGQEHPCREIFSFNRRAQKI